MAAYDLSEINRRILEEPKKFVEECDAMLHQSVVVAANSIINHMKDSPVVLLSGPSGSGKTTTAVNLGAYLAALGNSVLLVDADPQANATRGLGFEPDKLPKTTANVVLGPDFFEDVIHHTTIFGYELAPASIRLEDVQIQLAKARKKETRLKTALEAIKQDYDFVLIDCPPGLGLLTANGLAAAQSAGVPLKAVYAAALTAFGAGESPKRRAGKR